MSKSIFRWLRGELNGFYLTSIHETLNVYTKDIRDFFSKWGRMQFTLDSMSADNIYGIGKFAGVFLPKLSHGEGYGTFRMTESKVINGEERSERGLYSRDTEVFEFNYAEDETIDINAHADIDHKSSLPGTEDITQGYIGSDTAGEIIDEDGNVVEDQVSPTPYNDQAYVNYYGNKFLFLAEEIKEINNINIKLFYELYKIMQWVRYNGTSIDTFCELVEVICPYGLVKINSIEHDPERPCFNVYYTYDADVHINLKNQRIMTFKYVVNLKFPQFTLQEINTRRK